MDNRTLNFFSADVATQKALMRSMGLEDQQHVDSGNSASSNAAVIVDSKMETVYVMDPKKKLDRESLEDFIYR